MKWYSIRLLVVAFVIGFLSTSNASLIAYISGTGLTDQDGAVMAFSLGYLVLGTIFSTFVHFFILGVASVFAFLGLAFVKNARKKDDNVGGTPTPTTAGDNALIAFAKKFVIVVLAIALAIAVWQSIGIYILLSAVSEAAGLIVLTTVLTFILSFVYGACVVGFIGAVATFMLSVLVGIFGNGSNSTTR